MHGIPKTIHEAIQRIGYVRSTVIALSLALVGATEGFALVLLTTVFGQFSQQAPALGLFANVGAFINVTIGIPGLLVIFLVIVGIQQVVEYLANREVAKHASIYLQEKRFELHEAMQSARWEFVAKQEESQLRFAYTELPQIMADANDLIIRLFVSGIVIVVTFFFLFQIEPTFAFTVLIILLLLGSVFLRLDHRLKTSAKILIKSQRNYFRRLEQIITTLKIVKLANANLAVTGNLYRAAVEHSEKIYQTWKLNRIFLASYRYTLALLMAGFLFWAHQMEMDPIRILILLAIMARTLPRANTFQSSLRRLVGKIPFFEEFEKLTNELVENREINSNSHLDETAPLESIGAEEVNFGYWGGQPVLDGVSLKLQKGEIVGISGFSGAGKTTLCNILVGLLSPVSGTVTLNDDHIHEAEMHRLRRNVSYVDQSQLVFGGTLRENLLLGSTQINDMEILSVFQELGLDGLVQQLPDGLDGQIRDHGQSLSGGQRQRIAIARALLSNKQFIVLDEFSSALDAENQKLVLEAIFRRREKFAALIVSHRSEVLSQLDRNFILRDGKLIDAT